MTKVFVAGVCTLLALGAAFVLMIACSPARADEERAGNDCYSQSCDHHASHQGRWR